jgi:predicted signal transduction protein with EAL and GGDEF domain
MREADIALYKAKEGGRGQALAFAEEDGTGSSGAP